MTPSETTEASSAPTRMRSTLATSLRGASCSMRWRRLHRTAAPSSSPELKACTCARG